MNNLKAKLLDQGNTSEHFTVELNNGDYFEVIGRDKAEFIVQACNSHAEMLEALELVDRAYVKDGVSMATAIDAVLLAIAKAKGEVK